MKVIKQLSENSNNPIGSKRFIKEIENTDIYSGNESMRFTDRHPIFKTLLKLEFEDVLRRYIKNKNHN